MVATHETVFTVLGNAARQRRTHSLVGQLVASVVIGAAVLVLAPQWWSLAFLAGWSAAYSGWGLLARVAELHAERRSLRALLTTIAALGTALAIAGIIGVGLAIYAGDAAGAKNACGRNSTIERCRTFEHPPKLTKLP